MMFGLQRAHAWRRVLFTTAVVVFGLAAVAVQAGTIYVCWDGSGDHVTIQEGIDAAQDGDEVVVCDGTYTGPGNKDLDFGGRLITVRSENGPENCIIDCEGDGRGFDFDGGETNASMVEGFTVFNAHASDGGGVRCHSSASPTIVNCVFLRCIANRYGGAVYGIGSGARIVNCTIRDCSAEYGGGILFDQCRDAEITNCAVAWNTATEKAGGIYCYQFTDIPIVNCTVVWNSAPHGGGGVHVNSCYPVILNSILWRNLPYEIRHEYDGRATVRFSDVRGGYNGYGNIDADPLFVDLYNDDYHLSPGSPCIDAGCNWAVPPDAADLDDDGDTSEYTPFDLDGEGRFFDDPNTADTGCGCPPIVDMGAYEFGDTGPQPCPGDLDCDRLVGHSDLGILLSAWQNADDGDLNCDGVTDHSDLGILLSHWGEGCP